MVSDSTGLGSTLEAITQSYRKSLEQQATNNAISELTLEDIVNEQRAGNYAFDQELDNETLVDVPMSDDDDYFD